MSARLWSAAVTGVPAGLPTVVTARKAVGGALALAAYGGLGYFAGLTPWANPARHSVEVVRDVPYADDAHPLHRLDVYRKTELRGPAPVVVYFHGGAFKFLSKRTHWLMGLAFAKRGYVVFNVDYRLAPRDLFPAAVEDAFRAALWVRENAARYGGDPERIVAAGDSAGANLAASLMVATCYKRPEPFAREVWDAGLRLRACLPACGILQVTDWERFARRRPLGTFLKDRLEEVSTGYLPAGATPESVALADPLCILERDPPDRPLPPVFAFAGTADPLLDDTRRLKAALDAHGARCEARYYRGGVHAFHALIWQEIARRAWHDMLEAVDGWVAEPTAGS